MSKSWYSGGLSAGIAAIVLFVSATVQPTIAQNAAKPTTAQNPWPSSCVTTSRDASPNCFIKQDIYLKNGGQLVASVKIDLAANAKRPTMIIQTPLGLYLPAGLVYDIDGDKTTKLDLQTCDRRGCYTAAPVSKALLGRLRAGGKMNLHLKDRNRKKFTIPVTLNGFTNAYNKID